MRWYRSWRKHGQRGLAKSERLGRPPELSGAQLDKVEKVLLEGPEVRGYSSDLWTLPRIAGVIEDVTGVRYHPGHVWRVLRGMGWSLQRPTLRARERDEEAIRRWKKERWPRLKKASGQAGP
jgi:transposase